jgi:hypothetical protein
MALVATNNTIQMDIKENFSCCGMFNPHFLDNYDVTINIKVTKRYREYTFWCFKELSKLLKINCLN